MLCTDKEKGEASLVYQARSLLRKMEAVITDTIVFVREDEFVVDFGLGRASKMVALNKMRTISIVSNVTETRRVEAMMSEYAEDNPEISLWAGITKEKVPLQIKGANCDNLILPELTKGNKESIASFVDNLFDGLGNTLSF